MEQSDGEQVSLPKRRSSLKERMSPQSQGRQTPEDFRGPLGLNLLHLPPEPLVDIVFVHGIAGGSRDTWSKSKALYYFWPKSWLSKDPDFKRHARIYSFGYAANLKEWKSSLLRINDFARSLLMELKNDPEIRKDNTRIILVGYSMGGLVTKKAYILARQDQGFNNIASRVHTMYFLATPHRGSDTARTLANILQVTTRPRYVISDLKPGSEMISSINENFRLYADDLQLCSFYESKPCTLVSNSLVVDKDSATLGYRHEFVAPLNADHKEICKFENPTDSNYKTVRNALSGTVKGIVAEALLLKKTTDQGDLQLLASVTGVNCAPEDDLLALKDARFDGSCEWLDSKMEFEEWQHQESEPKSAKILWVVANPGFGKSVITSHVVDRLKEQGFVCSYFFFREGIQARSTIGDCLRSLAFQMALYDEQVRKRLVLLHNSVTFDLNDDRAVWQKLFVECIFQTKTAKPHYWAIDALNQSSNYHYFFRTIGRVGAYKPLRVFVTSRHIDELSRSFDQLGETVTLLQIQISDTFDDINRFIMDRSKRLPVIDQERSSLARRILTKANGSFLWVRLVMQDLENVWSLEDIEKVLKEVPADMNRYYTKILDKIYEDSKRRELVEAILTWTVCASRLLTVAEMQYALKLDIKQTPLLGLEKLISLRCGQLVFVDQGSRVQEYHHTVKEFLLQKHIGSKHALDKAKAHTRLAKVCLEFLSGSDFQSPRRSTLKHGANKALVDEGTLASYACPFFSDHLLKSSSWDSEPWDALHDFLSRRNVLIWIDNVATTGDLHTMMRTATNIKAYLHRRAKHYPSIGPLSQQVETIKAWSVDLIRVCAKFRTNLLTSPASIYYLIPPMCPANSMLAKQFTSPHRGLTVMGSATKEWDDCFSQINYFGSQTTAVACGDRYFAVGLSTGKVMIYYNISSHAKHVLDHQERVKILRFGPQNAVIATIGVKHLRLWDLSGGHQLWSASLSSLVLALAFPKDDESWLFATQDGYVTWRSLANDSEPTRIRWAGGLDKDANKIHGRMIPTHAVFSPDCNLLAVGYRAHCIMLYAVTQDQLVYHGECVRKSDAGVKKGTIVHYPIATMIFNPNPEFECLIISYRDGELVIYDTQTLDIKHRLWNVNAQALACSPDGRSLVTGGAFGSLRIYDLDRIRDGGPPTLIYRLNANREGFKGLAFSNDNLQFIGIRGSQCRVWEPAALVRRESHECDSSELSDPISPISPGPEDINIDNDDTRSLITAMACHHNGEMMFCGRSDGSVTLFETENARETATLYKHVMDVSINFLAWGKEANVLISADESSRVVVRRLDPEQLEKTEVMADRRFNGSITALLLNPENNRLLISGDDFDELWTMEGKTLASRVHENHHRSQVFNRTICHPHEPDCLITFEPLVFKIYSWIDLEELTKSEGVQINRTCAPLIRNSEVRTQYRGSDILIELVKSNWDPTSWILECWQAKDFERAASSVSALPGFEEQGPRVEYLIVVTDNTVLYYLDTDMWVCSLDLKEFPISKTVNRHFFIPSDWRSTSGDMLFQLTSKEVFLFAKQSELMVIKRGLSYSEQVLQAKTKPPLLRTRSWNLPLSIRSTA